MNLRIVFFGSDTDVEIAFAAVFTNKAVLPKKIPLSIAHRTKIATKKNVFSKRKNRSFSSEVKKRRAFRPAFHIVLFPYSSERFIHMRSLKRALFMLFNNLFFFDPRHHVADVLADRFNVVRGNGFA